MFNYSISLQVKKGVWERLGGESDKVREEEREREREKERERDGKGGSQPEGVKQPGGQELIRLKKTLRRMKTDQRES
jgi:hypothetical protein